MQPSFRLRGAPAPATYPESAALVFDQALTANQSVTGATINVDNVGAFQLEGICGTQTGSYKLRLVLPDGRNYPQVQGNNNNLVGTGVFPVLLPVPVVYPAGSQIRLDILETSGNPNTIELVLTGTRLIPTR